MFVGGGGDNSDDGDTANWLSIYDVPAMYHSKHSNPITSTLTATPTKKVPLPATPVFRGAN